MYKVVEIHGIKYEEYPELFGKHIYIQSNWVQAHRQHIHDFLEKQGEEWVRAHVDTHSRKTSDKHFHIPGYTEWYEMVWRDAADIAILVHDRPE